MLEELQIVLTFKEHHNDKQDVLTEVRIAVAVKFETFAITIKLESFVPFLFGPRLKHFPNYVHCMEDFRLSQNGECHDPMFFQWIFNDLTHFIEMFGAVEH